MVPAGQSDETLDKPFLKSYSRTRRCRGYYL